MLCTVSWSAMFCEQWGDMQTGETIDSYAHGGLQRQCNWQIACAHACLWCCLLFLDCLWFVRMVHAHLAGWKEE